MCSLLYICQTRLAVKELVSYTKQSQKMSGVQGNAILTRILFLGDGTTDADHNASILEILTVSIL